jgi:tetratricopeptide (TPR) repeat protein
MGVFDFIKNRKRNKDIEEIFKKATPFAEAKQLVDKAISYRNLKQYEKAIKILEDVLTNYPFYLPAKTILGTTLLKKGEVNKAENQFKKILSEHATDGQYALAEVYANLGALNYFQKDNKEAALEYYQLGLKSPKPENIDSKLHELSISNIYRDLSLLYSIEGDYLSAKKYATLRLSVNKNCPIATKAYGASLFDEFMNDKSSLKYFTEDIECKLLNAAVENIRISLDYNPKDYLAVAIMETIIDMIRITRYYNKDDKLFDEYYKQYEKYLILKEDSKISPEAKKYYDLAKDRVMNNFKKIFEDCFGIKVTYKKE